MGFFSDLISGSDPEGAVRECSNALDPIWEDIHDQLRERGKEAIFTRFTRHPFVLGTVYGFVRAVAHDKGVEVGTEGFNGVLAATLQALVGVKDSMELGDKINRLWIEASEGDPQFEKGIDKGSFLGQMYVEGLERGGEVLTADGISDQGPKEPVHKKPLSESYWRIIEKKVL